MIKNQWCIGMLLDVESMQRIRKKAVGGGEKRGRDSQNYFKQGWREKVHFKIKGILFFKSAGLTQLFPN